MGYKIKNALVNTSIIVLTGLVGYTTYKLLFFAQKYVYIKPGEIFYNSGHLIILALGVSLLFFLTVLLNYDKLFPNLSAKQDLENERQGIDIDKMLRVIWWGRNFVIVFCLVFLGSFNSYVKLSDNYITVSSWSLLPWSNEKQYTYSDVSIGYDYGTSKYGYTTNSKSYDFQFPDNKRVYDIFQNQDLINKIQQKQKDSNFIISYPKENYRKNSSIASYARFGIQVILIFFFLWIFQSFYKKEK